MAVLDCLINPQWPYLPEKKERYDNKIEEEGVERAWSTVPDDPLNYQFRYHLLEADEHGQLPILNGEKNPEFKHASKSALHYIAESNNKVFFLLFNIDLKCVYCSRPKIAKTNVQ